MTFGEKLQKLRRAQGMSQEQLAIQLGLSRQAVSKWELNEATPDTENVVQISRIFAVSTDYLLLDEVDEPSGQPPKERTNPHAATIIGLAACAVGLLAAGGGWAYWQTAIPLAVGLIIQVVGVALFELQTAYLPPPGGPAAARARFYSAACWLLAPIPVFFGCGLCFRWFVLRSFGVYLQWTVVLAVYLLVCVVTCAVLARYRRRS